MPARQVRLQLFVCLVLFGRTQLALELAVFLHRGLKLLYVLVKLVLLFLHSLHLMVIAYKLVIVIK